MATLTPLTPLEMVKGNGQRGQARILRCCEGIFEDIRAWDIRAWTLSSWTLSSMNTRPQQPAFIAASPQRASMLALLLDAAFRLAEGVLQGA